MGLIDFVRDAGERIFHRKEREEREEQKMAEQLSAVVTKLGLEIDGLTIGFDDGKATVRGTAPTQALREKIVLVLGNTQGVAQVDDQIRVVPPAPLPEPEPPAVFYTVKSGDSLSKIAKTHYGDAMKYPLIFEANTPMLKDPNKIYPGQVLRIPPLAEK